MNALTSNEPVLAADSSAAAGVHIERAFTPVTVLGRAARTAALRRSPRLRRTSPQTAVLANALYGREPLRRSICGSEWRFRWLHTPELFASVLLRLKVCGVELIIGLEDPALFTVLADVMRPELPPELRVPYLLDAGAALWRELEAITQCTVELTDVQHDCATAVAGDCVGFELGRGVNGPGTRGFLRPDDTVADDSAGDGALRILCETSNREMPRAPLPTDLPIQWAAVIGSTMLPTAEVAALQAGDAVVVDHVTFTPDALSCWLGAGVDCRYAGRATVRQGQLHLIDFATGGKAVMQATAFTQRANDAGVSRDASLGELQVNLRFELARWQAPLAEMAALAAGTVIDLGRRIDEPSISLWVEQRCVGHGQLIAVGDRLGVRLSTIFGAAASDAAASRSSASDATDASAASAAEQNE